MGMLLSLLRSPKVAAGAVIAIALASVAIHYRVVVNERNDLRAARAVLETNIETLRANEQALQSALALERQAAATVAAERDAARTALDAFRAGRADDPESVEWAAGSIPAGELSRLCAALPGMEGC